MPMKICLILEGSYPYVHGGVSTWMHQYITEMKIERRKPRNAEVYTASLNDIMFFLMLFFLIIATMIAPATMKVVLPSSKTSSDAAIRNQIKKKT